MEETLKSIAQELKLIKTEIKNKWESRMRKLTLDIKQVKEDETYTIIIWSVRHEPAKTPVIAIKQLRDLIRYEHGGTLPLSDAKMDIDSLRDIGCTGPLEYENILGKYIWNFDKTTPHPEFEYTIHAENLTSYKE